MMPSDAKILETLLFSPCLLPGLAPFKEGKADVSISPQAGETILFFSTDDQSNSRCKLRQELWGDQQGQNICDLIVFYAKGDERVLCFVELKDNIKDLGDAVDQVNNTCLTLRREFGRRYYTEKAFISAPRSSAPKEKDEYEQQLKKTFKGCYKIAHSDDDNLGDFLRGIDNSKKGKRNNKGRRNK